MATPSSNPPDLTGDPRIDGLMEPSAWDTDGIMLTLTWSPHDYTGTWTAAELKLVQAAFDSWAAVANIEFVRVEDSHNFRHTDADLAVVASGVRLQNFEEAIGLAFTPDPNYNIFDLFGQHWTPENYPRSQGDIFIDNPLSGSYARGTTDFHTLIHEIGHALGLKHPHDEPRTFLDLGIGNMDDNGWTVMSYKHPNGIFQAVGEGWPVTPMPLDILAVQNIYGANMSYHTGNNVYPVLDNSQMRTVWDAGGTDTLDASHYTGGQLVLNLQAGVLNFNGHDSMIAVAYNVTIENAIGSPRGDELIGNAAANDLQGLGDNDSLQGGGGNDHLDGGNGLDSESGGAGADVVDGGAAADVLRGGAGNDTLNGGAGNDQLDGDAGADVLNGGAGVDRFLFNDALGAGNVDTITDFGGAGANAVDVIRLDDAVFTSLSAGALSAGQFVSGIGPVAAQANDFILYDTSTGELFYDADGNGAGDAVLFAVLATDPNALNNSDFLVV